jgi:RHS repeat-associated protein
MLSLGTDGTWNGNSWDWAADKGELWEYGYELSNRLISVKKSASGTDGLKAIAFYAYDIRGLRVESVKDSSTTYYQYGLKGELLWSDDGSTQEKYVYANATIWAEVRTEAENSSTYYHHTDHLGTTETITDASGTVVWDASYEAYGKLVHENGTVSFKASFTGKQVDSDTGLYYFNARWYDAELGRFVTEDPARDGSNWYEYCGNNPLVRIDPTGKTDAAALEQAGQNLGPYGVIFAVATAYVIDPNFRQGINDTVVDVCNLAVDSIKNTISTVQAVKARTKELTKSETDKKSTGSYTITFESGKTYSGKGPLKRASNSAIRESLIHGDMPSAVNWTPAAKKDDAFVDEYIRIQDHGGPSSRYSDAGKYNYNIIQSPGEGIYKERNGGQEYLRTIPKTGSKEN